MSRNLRRSISLVFAIAAASCGSAANPAVNSVLPPPAQSAAQGEPLAMAPQQGNRITHVIVIIQENRTVDNLFNGFPGADTVRSGENVRGQRVPLSPVSITAPYDLSHRHTAWLADYNRGKMNGFSGEHVHCLLRMRTKCPTRGVAAYSYVPKDEVKPYWEMAHSYVLGDHMFQTNQGPSFPAHQYVVSGTSIIADGSTIKAAENVSDPQKIGKQGGCDSVRNARVATINELGGNGPLVYPCFKRRSIMEKMNDAGVTWRYYQARSGAGQWHAVDAIEPIWASPTYKNVIWPSSRVLKDVAAGQLADVTFVTPTALASDHAGDTNGSGPDWVATIVDAVGESKFWKSTAIFVVWDDWGGWYDHVTPTVYNSYEDGFRVPLLVISPYAKQGYVSHTAYEFGSILKFIEATFKLTSLDTTDERANNFADPFDFGSSPRKFVPIPRRRSKGYFLSQTDDRSPDDDY